MLHRFLEIEEAGGTPRNETMSAPGTNTTVAGSDPGGPADSSGSVVSAVTILLLVLSFVFVALRVVSRLQVVKRWTWDDSLIVAAWVPRHS